MENLRYQDIVARVSGINLKSVVRVMRALEVVALEDGNKKLQEAVRDVLKQGAYNDGEPCPLHDRPSEAAAEACNALNSKVARRQSGDGIRALQNLEGCPYYASAAIDAAFAEPME